MKKGYTLSEVLITLGIVGVVAAMTLPTVIKNYQKKVTVEKLKSAYSLLYQAVRMSEIDNGTIDNWEMPAENSSYQEQSDFAKKYFTPYLKNTKECRARDCLSEYYYLLDGTKLNISRHYTLKLANGVVVTILGKGNHNVCRIVIDINGKMGPNTIGKDKFVLIIKNNAASGTTYYYGPNDKPGLYFYGQGNTIQHLKTRAYACSKTLGTGWRGTYCGAWIMQEGWKIPDDYPW